MGQWDERQRMKQVKKRQQALAIFGMLVLFAAPLRSTLIQRTFGSSALPAMQRASQARKSRNSGVSLWKWEEAGRSRSHSKVLKTFLKLKTNSWSICLLLVESFEPHISGPPLGRSKDTVPQMLLPGLRDAVLKTSVKLLCDVLPEPEDGFILRCPGCDLHHTFIKFIDPFSNATDRSLTGKASSSLQRSCCSVCVCARVTLSGMMKRRSEQVSNRLPKVL